MAIAWAPCVFEKAPKAKQSKSRQPKESIELLCLFIATQGNALSFAHWNPLREAIASDTQCPVRCCRAQASLEQLLDVINADIAPPVL